QLQASDLSGIDHWTLNDTIHFSISSTGRITSIGTLSPGRYGLIISVYDQYDNQISATITITMNEETTTTPEPPPPPGIPGFPALAIILGFLISIGVSIVYRRRSKLK
ncbi:MAG: Loki-CTERM sorting domain-containing protein, partial [Candidatus Odinarchaeota archaeon]